MGMGGFKVCGARGGQGGKKSLTMSEPFDGGQQGRCGLVAGLKGGQGGPGSPKGPEKAFEEGLRLTSPVPTAAAAKGLGGSGNLVIRGGGWTATGWGMAEVRA